MYRCSNMGIIRRNGFLYLQGMDKPKFRVPGDRREIKYISIEELADGLQTLIEQNVTASRDGLYKTLTNLLGFSRTGDAIVARFEEALTLLKQQDAVKEEELVEGMQEAGIKVETDEAKGQRELDEYRDAVREMRVYHGTTADFERFDHSHMGEGEGAQAYGWGTYVTEKKGVGKWYASKLAVRGVYHNGRKVDYHRSKAEWLAAFYIRHEGDVDAAIKKLEAEIEDFDPWAEKKLRESNDEKYKDEIKKMQRERHEALEMLKDGNWEGGKDRDKILYDVEIPDDNGSNYLEWDKPLSDEDMGVLRIELEKAMLAPAEEGVEDRRLFRPEEFKGRENHVAEILETRFRYGMRGELVYAKIEGLLGSDKAASEFLHSMGYDGIKIGRAHV